MYNPFFLRREKKEIFKTVSSEVLQRPLKWNELPLKTDLVVWIPLSKTQKEIYKLIIENQSSMLTEKGKIDKGHVFMLIMAMRQLCCHPNLFFKNPILKVSEQI